MRAGPKGRRTRKSQINKHGRKSFTRDRFKPYARRHPMLICWKCGSYQQMDETTAKILAQIQKAKPARIKERPRKVSFVILLSQAGAARRNILCFQYCFQCFFVLFCFFFFRVKAFNSIPHYRDRVYDPDPERSYTKAKREKLKRSNVTVESAVKQTSPDNSPFDSFPSDESTDFSEDFSILPSFVPMDAFEQDKNSGYSIKKFANAEVVINSNDEGAQQPRKAS